MCVWKISISTYSRNKNQTNNTIKLHASLTSLNNHYLKIYHLLSLKLQDSGIFPSQSRYSECNKMRNGNISPSPPPLSYLLWWFLIKTSAIQTKERGGYSPTPPPNWALRSSNSFLLPWAAWHCLVGLEQLLFQEAASAGSQSICLLFMGWCLLWCWQLSQYSWATCHIVSTVLCDTCRSLSPRWASQNKKLSISQLHLHPCLNASGSALSVYSHTFEVYSVCALGVAVWWSSGFLT